MAPEIEDVILTWLERVEKKVDRLTEDMAALKVKAGVWGLVGGAIPAAVVIAYIILKS